MKNNSQIVVLSLAVLVVSAVIYLAGYNDGSSGREPAIDNAAVAQTGSGGWSPTGEYPIQEVYFPGTEELAPDEMRVIACGSGMPMPRLKQAAACFLVELGNGDKFIFDLGTGSFTTLYALGMPLDYMTKIFISHQHADHMGDLPTMWIYGMQNGRSQPLNIWGPGGGGMADSWGTKSATDGILKFYNWMLETSKGGLDTRSLQMNVTEFDWSKVNNIIYEQNGVVIRTVPAIHLDGSVAFILEWNGIKLVYGGDSLASKWFIEAARGADLAIHECMLPNEYFMSKYKFQPPEAIYVSTLVHTTASVFGKLMSLTQPKHAVGYHFQNDADTLPAVVSAVRAVYDGPVDFAVDGMVWNVTKAGVRTRVSVMNTQPFPPPSVVEREQGAPGGEKYETPEWILQGFAWDILPTMDKVHEDFNEANGTDFEFPLKPKPE